jgi:hypothetical protein
MSGPERRQYERFELLAQVGLRRGTQLETLTAINISAGGVFLINERNIELSVGEDIRVHIDVPDLAPAFALDATVIRVIAPTARPAAVAAMWTSSDPVATAGLAQILWSLKR